MQSKTSENRIVNETRVPLSPLLQAVINPFVFLGFKGNGDFIPMIVRSILGSIEIVQSIEDNVFKIAQ